MKKLIYLLPFLLLLLSSCASQNITTLDQTGRQVPMPHYVLKSMDDNFQVLFYWSKHKGTLDLDGTPIDHPMYFDYTKKDAINPKKIGKIILTIEVLNRDNRKYELWERTVMVDRQKRRLNRGGMVAYSNQKSRVHQFTLPINQDLKSVDFAIDLIDSNSGMPIMRFGNYEYKIIK